MSKPPANGNSLRDYKISTLEEIVKGHDARIRILEDIQTRQGGGISLKQLMFAVTTVFSAIGAMVAAYYQMIR